MTLKEHIEDINKQLKQRSYPNEAAVSLVLYLGYLSR